MNPKRDGISCFWLVCLFEDSKDFFLPVGSDAALGLNFTLHQIMDISCLKLDAIFYKIMAQFSAEYPNGLNLF